MDMTKTYEVTGIRHHIGDPNSDFEERTRLAEQFIKELPSGTPLILMAEPDNPWDEKAIAVYMGFTRLIGYIKHEQCDEVLPLLDDDAQAEATVSGNDGHVTLHIVIDNAPDSPPQPQSRQRILPKSPLSETVLLPFSEAENRLKLVAQRLMRLELSAGSAPQLIELLEAYVPLASLSFSYEDNLWRDKIFKKADQALEQRNDLKMTDDQTERLSACRQRLRAIQGEFHRTHKKRLGRLFDEQLMQLSGKGAEADVLFHKFEEYYIKGTREVRKTKILMDERDKLVGWFHQMRWPELHDFTNHHQLAVKLNYLGVSRRELYDIFSAIMLIDKLEIMLGNKKLPRAKTDESQLLFSEKAMVYWERLKEKQYVDEEYKPTDVLTRQDKMLIAELFSGVLGIKSKWSVFEKLWNIEHLAQEKQNWIDFKANPVHETEIRQIFL